jgi:beta-glucosidase
MDRRNFLFGSAAAVASRSLNKSRPNDLILAETGISADSANLPHSFPDGFYWGVSTAAYQVEGAWNADGKGESVWDRYTHTPGTILAAGTGDVACDFYTRYTSDIQLAKQQLNVKSLRFSISWSRILPSGKGAVNQKGLDHYQRLTDVLLKNDIRPLCTLFHWDFPQGLMAQGAWRSRETVANFLEYTEVVVKTLGDRIKNWAILNEPTVFARYGYGYPAGDPVKTSFNESLRAQHNVNLVQGQACHLIHSLSPSASVGSALAMYACYPANDTPEDKAAAERYHGWQNLWFLEPAMRGKYPQAFIGEVPLDAMGFQPGDEKLMHAPLDWIGINNYNRYLVSAVKVPPGVKGEAALAAVPHGGTEGPLTANGWEVWPKGHYDIVMRITKEFDKPIIEITENGCSYDDGPDAQGRVPDTQRFAYYKAHLIELARAIQDGARVRGYHAWSLLDDFEWHSGYTQRFGLVWIDFRDQRRIVKDSGYWYGKVTAGNCVV